MHARRLEEVRELVASADFQSWWKSLERTRKQLADAEAQREELLAQLNLVEFRAELAQKNAIDTLYRSGESEDKAATLHAEAATLENRSFPGVAAFEEHRFKVSEIWYRLGALESQVDQARELKRPQAEIVALDRQRQFVADEYERETSRKNSLWEEVESLWARSAEISLLRSEHQLQARKIRQEAESGFRLAEERKKQTQSLRAECEASAQAVEAAKAQLTALASSARDRFGATVGIDFLFFRHPADSKQGFAISLVEDLQSYNVEVRPLTLFSVERERGVAFLEPARTGGISADEGDRRFETYFLQGRKAQQAPAP